MDKRIIDRIVNFNVVAGNQQTAAQSIIRFYLPAIPEVLYNTITNISYSDVFDDDDDTGYYLTLVDKNHNTIISQQPLNDFQIQSLDGYAFLYRQTFYRLYNLKNINTLASYIDYIVRPAKVIASGTVIATLQFVLQGNNFYNR